MVKAPWLHFRGTNHNKVKEKLLVRARLSNTVQSLEGLIEFICKHGWLYTQFVLTHNMISTLLVTMAAEYVPLLPEEAWHMTVLWQESGIRFRSADQSSDSDAGPGLKRLASYRFMLLATRCHFGHTSVCWDPEASNTNDCGCTWHIFVHWEELLWGTVETACYHVHDENATTL